LPAGVSSARAYRLGVALGTAGLLGTAVALAVGLSVVSPERRHARVVQALGAAVTVPRTNAAALFLLPLALVGAVVTLRALRAGLGQWRALRRLMESLEIVGPLAQDPSVTVIDDPRPAAFCAGYARPRVYVSQGALSELGPEELGAVLAHEALHCRQRDPLRIACVAVLSHALFFVPVMRRLTDRFRALAELAADDAALVTTGGDPSALASAMLRFAEFERPTAVGVEPERVDHLLGRTIQWPLPLGVAIASMLGLVCVALAALELGRQALLEPTLNLPLLSQQPCVLVLAALPIIAATAVVTLARR
jgi:Zn-dependent protease with chaperone function